MNKQEAVAEKDAPLPRMFYGPVTLEQIVFAVKNNVDGFRDKLREALAQYRDE